MGCVLRQIVITLSQSIARGRHALTLGGHDDTEDPGRLITEIERMSLDQIDVELFAALVSTHPPKPNPDSPAAMLNPASVHHRSDKDKTPCKSENPTGAPRCTAFAKRCSAFTARRLISLPLPPSFASSLARTRTGSSPNPTRLARPRSTWPPPTFTSSASSWRSPGIVVSTSPTVEVSRRCAPGLLDTGLSVGGRANRVALYSGLAAARHADERGAEREVRRDAQPPT